MRDRKLELKIFIIIISLYILIVIWGILFANRLETLFYDPPLTPEEWCQEHPCLTLNIFGIIVTLAVPTSTFFVYLLSVETAIVGIFIIIRSNENKSQLWWGIALILWGLGTLFAGTSYQAFSYELKCANRTFCIWTTWFEIMYLISSVGSINAMVIAQKYSCLPEKYHHIANIYAIGNFSLYSIITLIGAYLPIRFLISFELMILFLAPNILIFLILNSWRYVRHKKRMDRNLMVIWCSLIIIIGLYFLYYSLGITEFFWQFGFWFSANDILHIGLIIWMVSIYFTVNTLIED
ncbi:MAG: hypothetical protein GF311_15625 [Candidatus Lokiarchaeota archaeon]|nr:hypothetical protein [Candidatus Lokiarchaeota archaeon]